MSYFYVLESKKDGKLYYGPTTDLERRLKQHNAGKVTSTHYRRPLTLVHCELFDTIEQARAREHHAKNSAAEREKIKSALSQPV